MKIRTLLLTLAVAFPVASSFAQGPGRPPGPPPGKGPQQPDGQRPKGQDGQRPDRGPQDPGDHPPGPMAVPPLLHALDTDDDGIISADEIKNAPASLATLDKNGDKQITPDELRPPHPEQGGGKKGNGDQSQKKADGDKPDKKAADWPFAKDKTGKTDDQAIAPKAGGDQGAKGTKVAKGDKPQGPPPSTLLGALDTDHDGIISEEEIAKSSDSLLKLDKNGDGQLGPREYNAPPQGGPKEVAPKPAE